MGSTMGSLEISQSRPTVLMEGGEFCLHGAILVVTTGGWGWYYWHLASTEWRPGMLLSAQDS